MALEIHVDDERIKVSLSPDQADALGRQLEESARAVRRSQRIKALKSYMEQFMVELPEGRFEMGSPGAGPGSDMERPVHLVTVPKAFMLSRVAVTQELFKMVMGSNPSRFSGPKHPVEQVSWFDAARFCNELSGLMGLAKVYQFSGDAVVWKRYADGFRLPTEAEWEYAARAGREDDYSGGSNFEAVAWTAESGEASPSPVGQKSANPWGLFDMSGNVYEWCWDWFGAYGAETVADPVGPAEPAAERVCRGGSWNRSPWFSRVTGRGGEHPSARSAALGFRIARKS